MDGGTLFALTGVVAIVLIITFSILAGRVESRLWRKCRRRSNCMRTQQFITMGKSHCR